MKSVKSLVLGALAAEAKSPAVHGALRMLQAAVVAVVVAYLKSNGLY